MKKQMTLKKTLLTVLMAGSLGLAGHTLYASPNYDGAHGGSDYQCKHGKRGKHGMKHMSPEKRVEKMAQHLGLSEAQKQQVLSLMTTHKANMKPLRDQKHALRRSMHSLDPNAADYMAQLTNLAEQKANLVRQKTLAKGQHRQQLFALLTPEQQNKMRQMHEKRMQKRMQNMGQ